jgi:hypothetical protein
MLRAEEATEEVFIHPYLVGGIVLGLLLAMLIALLMFAKGREHS